MRAVRGDCDDPAVTFAPYLLLLRRTTVRRLLLLGVVARIPHTAAGVALTLHVVIGLDRGYLQAGLVAAAVTVGMAVGAPWRGRAVDRLGLRRALVPSVVAEVCVWGSAPFLPYAGLLAVAVVGGLLTVPVFTVVRQSLSVLVPPEGRRSAYALDSVFVELSFAVGPALGALVATQVSTTVALLGVGVAAALAGLALMALDPPTRSEQLVGAPAPTPGDALRSDGPEDDAELAAVDVVGALAPVSLAGVEHAGHPDAAGPGQVPAADPAAPGRVASGVPAIGVPASGVSASGVSAPDESPARGWVSPALLLVLATSTGATMVLFGTDVSAVAFLEGRGSANLLGLVFGAWAIGSIVGGLAYGAWSRPVHPLWLLLGLGLLTAPMGLAGGIVGLCVLIAAAGLLCAPTISATAEAVASLVPERVRGEAMGWHGSALTVGGAVGAPVAGSAIDVVGPWAGFVVAGGLGAVVAVAGLLVLRGTSARISSPGR